MHKIVSSVNVINESESVIVGIIFLGMFIPFFKTIP